MTAPRNRRPSRSFDAFGPETCVIYLRISQDRTGEGLGVERQERDSRALAARLGLRVVRVYTDNDISATNGKTRPDFEAMLRDRPEVIVAWHQDRLLRLTSDLEKVIALGVDVHFVTAGMLDLATPAGRAVARTIAAWSQYETEQKATRQKSANLQRAEMGAWAWSNRPYGYERPKGTKPILVVPEEAEIVRELYRRYVEGESYYALSKDLNERGVPTVTGVKWSAERIRALLRVPGYAGVVVYQGEQMPDVAPTWEPLIDRRLWDDYLAVRESRARSGWGNSTRHLSSGLIVCGKCGGPLTAKQDKRAAKRVYACRRGNCVYIDADGVDESIEALVIARLADKRIIRTLRHVPDTAPLEAELRKVSRARDNIMDLLAEGVLDKRAARSKAEALTERIDALKARLRTMRRESPLTDLALARSVPSKWKALGVLERRRVIDEIGLRVTVQPSRPGRRTLGPGRLPLPFDTSRLTVSWVDPASEDGEAA